MYLQFYFMIEAHGTFIGNVRIESNQPTQLPTDSTFHFGASTRYYTIREKPLKSGKDGDREAGDASALPENELELDVSFLDKKVFNVDSIFCLFRT